MVSGTRLGVRIVAFAVILLCTLMVLPVLAARVLGGNPPRPWPELAALTPMATGLAVLAFLAALLTRVRGATVLPGVLMATLLVWQFGPGTVIWWQQLFGSRPTSASGARGGGGGELRVLTVNTGYGRADVADLVAQVRSRKIDVLSVQELTPELVTGLGAAGLRGELPHSVLRPEEGYTGTGIWSRWPVTPLGDIPGTQSATPRTRVQPPSGPPFTVIAVHPTAPAGLGTDKRWRTDLHLVRDVIRETAGGGNGPLVVAGDFNATRDHALFRELLAPGLDDALDVAPGGPWLGFTFPVGQGYPPLMRLDHILFTRNGLRCVSAATVPVPGTDHRGVVAAFRLL
jgi:endonuclease/exonuclease/phosphatase (EEP) superfamily protein YafD